MRTPAKQAQIAFAVALAFSITGFFTANATPAFARKEHKACAFCHLNPHGGGPRGFRGIYYATHHLSFKGFNEKIQAKLAGVKPGSMGRATKPTKPYGPKHGHWKHHLNALSKCDWSSF